MGIDCCFKRPRLADPSLQDEVAQPAGRPVLCRYLLSRPNTKKTKQNTYHLCTAGGLPSAAPGPSLSSRRASAAKSSSLGPSAPVLYCSMPSPSHFSFHAGLLLTLPKCPSMAWFYDVTLAFDFALLVPSQSGRHILLPKELLHSFFIYPLPFEVLLSVKGRG